MADPRTRRSSQRHGAAAIRSLPFRHPAKPALGFEIFRLSRLYDRADRKTIDHALETPQRPEFHTVYVGLRGSGRLVVDFMPTPLGANRLTFVARGRVQHFIPDRTVDAWLLLFTPELLAPARDAADPLALPACLSPTWSAPSIHVPPADMRDLLAIVGQIEAEHARPFDALQPHALAALLRFVLLRAERLVAGQQPPVPAAVQRFLTILERDHAATRSVAHYAKQTGLSQRRLAELVHAQTGKPPKQVIDERVILEHKRLLVHTEISIKELAARTGFAEPTNLVKFFRHHTQLTPLAFRQAHHRRFLPSSRGS